MGAVRWACRAENGRPSSGLERRNCRLDKSRIGLSDIAEPFAEKSLTASTAWSKAVTAAEEKKTIAIDPDVQEMADHFGLDERITKDLDDELKKRPATAAGD